MDKTIIDQVNAGDKKAFKSVFDSYYIALCTFTYKYIRDQAEIEDIVQEVFVSFWEHKKDFDHANGIKAFHLHEKQLSQQSEA